MFYHLILTDSCNLCCSYCRGKTFDKEEGNGIDVEIDEYLPLDFNSGIEDLCEFLKRDPDAVLTFYGGEPLMRMDLVRDIMDRAPVRKFMIQTNGTLLHLLEPEYVNRLDTILVSVDGPRELTDLHRGKGVFDRIIGTLHKIRSEGFNGEIIARMTVVENTDIHRAVQFLASNPFFSFSSIHWQIDADFSNDYRNRNFGGWVRESYNPGIKRLIREWVGIMEREGRVMRWYPFCDTMQDLLTGRKSRLRCGSGYMNYSIMTDGHIAPCPVMVGMKKYYLGHISTTHPIRIPEIDVNEPCSMCDIRDFCGGRCLYSNIIRPWPEDQRDVVCGTVRNLYEGLSDAVPEVCSLISEGRISMADFDHTRYNGCEIIP